MPRSNSLQFLAEADYTTMVYEDLPADARSALEEIRDDAVRREQYLDFFKLRRLRETLLCRADLTVLPEASTGAFDVLYFGVPLEPSNRLTTRTKIRSNSSASGTCRLPWRNRL